MGLILTALAAIIVSVLGRIFADEFKAFCPVIIDRLIDRAVNKLPDDMKERYAEEWRSCMQDIPGDIAKIWTAFGYNLVAGRLSSSFVSWEVFAKRALDLAIGGTGLFLLLPLMLTISAAVFAFDRKAPIFRQLRVGRDGRLFWFYQFRTMRIDGDAILDEHLSNNVAARTEWAAKRKLKDDPRFTPVGSILHKTGLDALTEFYSVWRGDMSLIGPRPIQLNQIAEYGEAFSSCFSVKPGLISLWMVDGIRRNNHRARINSDLEYVKTWSVQKDLKILFQFPSAALSMRDDER